MQRSVRLFRQNDGKTICGGCNFNTILFFLFPSSPVITHIPLSKTRLRNSVFPWWTLKILLLWYKSLFDSKNNPPPVCLLCFALIGKISKNEKKRKKTCLKSSWNPSEPRTSKKKKKKKGAREVYDPHFRKRKKTPVTANSSNSPSSTKKQKYLCE